MKLQGMRALVAFFALFTAGSALSADPPRFVRGDADASGSLDISDAILIFQFSFVGGGSLPCTAAADIDDNGVIDITDPINLLGFLFLGNFVPRPPFSGRADYTAADCGPDPTPDTLGCDRFPPCGSLPPTGPVPDPNDGPGSQEPVLDGMDGPAAAIYPRRPSTVVLNTGEARLMRVDLGIPGRGQIHFALERTYRSRLQYDGPLGSGWDFTYNEAIHEEAGGSLLRSDGSGHVDRWARNPDGSYTAPPGFFGTLVRRPDGSFAYREPDGFLRTYDSAGRLAAHEDPFGNRMRFERDGRGNLNGVVDAYGRRIDFVFETMTDGVDRLVRVRDYAGREVRYSYAAGGDLAAVTSPAVAGTSTGNDFPDGRTERYAYSAGASDPRLDHNLVAVTAPEEETTGPPFLRLQYGSAAGAADFDRVVSADLGGTNASGVPAGGKIQYAYQNLTAPIPPDPATARFKVAVTERNGNRFDFFADERRHDILHRRFTRGLRAGEPASYDLRSEYTADGLLARRTYPAGNATAYRYGTGPRAAQRDLIELRRIADANRGGGEDLVTTMTYEPIYHLIASLTDPRGNASAFTPPIGAASADRYTTRFLYDYQEGTGAIPGAAEFGLDASGVARKLGDLNGDGRTNQTAGNLVRRLDTAVTLLPASNEATRLGSTQQEVLTEYRWNDRGQLVGRVDAEGNFDTVEYFPEDDPDGDGTVVPGSTPGEARGYPRALIIDAGPAPARRTSPEPPAELESRYGYDQVGNVIRQTNPRGIETRMEVNQLNELVAVVRGAGTAAAVASGQLLIDTDPLGYRTRFFYDRNGRQVKREVENRDSHTPDAGEFVDSTYQFDILGRLVSRSQEVEDGVAVTWQFRYDPNELPAARTEPEGNQRRIEYDERNLTFRATRGFGTPDASTIGADYDLNGNVARVLDAQDHDGDAAPDATRYTYDGFDRRVRAIDRMGNSMETEYDPLSNATRRRVQGHPAGQPADPAVALFEERLSHDELGRVFQVDHPLFLASGFTTLRPADLRDENSDGVVTARFEYDALSRRTFTIEDDGEVARTVYDGVDRAVEGADAEGNLWSIDYDRNSNPVKQSWVQMATGGLISPQERGVSYVWDQLDRVARMSADHTVRFSYDSRDNLTERSDGVGPLADDPLAFPSGKTNEPGNTTSFFYDGRGLLTSVVRDLRQGAIGGQPLDLSNPFNPDGRVTIALEHDKNGRLAARADDKGSRTAFAYDALDRLVRQTFADGTFSTYEYDRDHYLVKTTDVRGTVVAGTYDALGRLIVRMVTLSAGVEGTLTQSFEYDGLSRLTAVVDDGGATAPSHLVERAYDSLSRMIEERQDGKACSRVWSGDGRLQGLVYPGGRSLTYSHDRIDRILEISDGATRVARYEWIGGNNGRLLERSHGNSTRLTLLDDQRTRDVGWDSLARPVLLRHLKAAAPFLTLVQDYNRADQRLFEERLEDGGLRDSYGYDSLYRVVQADYDQQGGYAPRRDLSSSAFAYDGAGNRREERELRLSIGEVLIPYDVNALNEYTKIGVTPRSHDANGNLTGDGGFNYAFDHRDRLVRVSRKSDGAAVASYEYDALDRRVRKTVFDPANPGTVVKSTRYLYDGWRAIEEEDDAEGTETTYVFGAGLDEQVEMRRTAASPLGAASLYYHQNVRGDVTALTDAGGDVVDRANYEAFGAPDRASVQGNPYLFQGSRYDPETGLYYFRHRYFDPRAGRFLQRDPVFDSGNDCNQYTFAGNGPVSRVDPLGLSWAGVADFFIGVLDVASEPINILRDTSKSVADATGVPLVIVSPLTWALEDSIWDARDKRKSEFHSMMAQGMEDRYVRRGWSAPATIGATMVEGAAMAYPPTAMALSGASLGNSIIEGDARGAGRATAGIVATAYFWDQHHSQTGSIFEVPVRMPPRATPMPPDIDPVTLQTMAETGMTPDTPLYRTTPTQYLDPATMTAAGNPESWARVMDPYNPITFPDGSYINPNIDAAALPHRTLNVALDPPAGNYGNAGDVTIQIQLGDVLAQGGRLYPDVGAAAGGIRPYIVTLPEGSVPFQYAPYTPPGPPTTWPLTPFFFTPHFNIETTPTSPDTFTVAPGIRTTLNVGVNDGPPGGGSYLLVTPPAIHPSLFEWRGNGTFSIAPLGNDVTVLTFTYKRVLDGRESSNTTVTVNVNAILLKDPPTFIDPVTGIEMVPVPTLLIGGLHYPIYQFALRHSLRDVCTDPHWHAFAPVFPLEQPNSGTNDPAPPSCGFGKKGEVPEVDFVVTKAAWDAFLAQHP